MNKKVYIPVLAAFIVAVLAGLWFTNQAFAKEDSFPNRFHIFRRGLGQITSISEGQFIIQRQDDEKYIVLVDENTRFCTPEKEELSFSDLEAGQWVSVIPARGEQEDVLAWLVVILPEDFNPAQFLGTRGMIISVDLAANQFILQTKDGEEKTFSVDEATRFLGQVEDLTGLDEEMQASVATQERADGSWLARVVRAGVPQLGGDIQKYLGRILSVDSQAGVFSLESRRGETLTFWVDEDTRFLDRNGQVQSLDDLQPEQVVLVLAREVEVDDLLAVGIVVGIRDWLPIFEAKAIGRVVSVDHNAFTLRLRSGGEINILVTGATNFRSWSGVVQGLDDLQPGMIVMVGGKELGNGVYQYQAELVLVIRIQQ